MNIFAVKRETIARMKCVKCRYQWFPRRQEVPKACPRCKRYDWDGKRNGKKP